MKTYFIILIASFIIPFIFSFEKQIYFIKNIKGVSKAIIFVALPYLIWDEIFTLRKVWGFSDNRIVGLKIFNLPVEEILFFVVVPYALIFIYEVINFYLQDKPVHIDRKIFLVIAFLFLILSILFNARTYTFVQFLLTFLFFISAYFFNWKILNTKNFWILVAVSYIPFFIVNYFLTSFPVVWYNENEIIGLRIITIPVEDFFYHFNLISFYLIAYNYFKEKK